MMIDGAGIILLTAKKTTGHAALMTEHQAMTALKQTGHAIITSLKIAGDSPGKSAKPSATSSAGSLIRLGIKPAHTPIQFCCHENLLSLLF